ncbi:hypothetical protein, partial [Pseudescherichia sp.]|uniref:hypothetical protein n=1 Tax=Pseudescherichia sp. TaxID=2055881 RepID=UPI0028A5FD53
MGVNELSILGMTSLVTADIVTIVTNKVNVLVVDIHLGTETVTKRGIPYHPRRYLSQQKVNERLLGSRLPVITAPPDQ